MSLAMIGPISAAPAYANPRPDQWTPENENQVKSYINEAMTYAHGDVEKAFAYLRDMRQQPQHYYDTNMAIAADYLRARWDTQRFGPQYETDEVTAYLALKRTTGVPKEGPGPVSPYSDLEARYMYKGIADQVSSQSIWTNLWQNSPPGVLFGDARGVWSLVENPLEGAAHKAEGAIENIGSHVLKFFHL